MSKSRSGDSIHRKAAIASLCVIAVTLCGCSDTTPPEDSPESCSTGRAYDQDADKCLPVCGDGLRVEEECDDGNVVNGDGCNDKCKFEGRACINIETEPTLCPDVCTDDIYCGNGKCVNTQWGPTCECDDYIAPACEIKRCLMTAGLDFTIALDSEGTPYAWGDNTYGQLANANVTNPNAFPKPIVDLPNLWELQQLNAYPVGNHTLAVDNKGTIWSWGDDTGDKLGDMKAKPYDVIHYTPPQFNKSPVTHVSAGSTHSLAIYETNIHSWGITNKVPADVAFAKVAACDNFNLALDNGGNVYSWGENNLLGQLGTGDNTPREIPTAVKFPKGTMLVAIACGEAHSMALSTDGIVWVWGSNNHLQLGDSIGGNSLLPIKVTFDNLDIDPDSGDGRIMAIAAGAHHGVAMDAARHVWTWGDNTVGQLGYTTDTSSQAKPQIVEEATSLEYLADIDSIDAGGSFTLALRRDGTLMVWGDNSSGQLGRGNFDKTPLPKMSQFNCIEKTSE